MGGVANELALRHIPQIAPRRDELAGPVGRRSDQVAASLCLGEPQALLLKICPCAASCLR